VGDPSATPSIVLTPVLKAVSTWQRARRADVPDAEIYIDQNKHPDNTPATIQNVPVGVHVIEVRKGGQSWTKPVTVVANTQVKLRAELAAGVGVVRVMSDTKDARAFIDGIDKGPIGGGVDIKDIKIGEHIIEIKAPGFKKYEEIVAVTPGSSKTVRKDLEADIPSGTGKLKVISTTPGAEVFIDGVKVENTQDLDKPAGTYIVQVRKPGFKQFEQKVSVEAGKPTTVTAELKQSGKLRVLSTPKGAVVSINGFEVGKTPVETDVETGPVVLEIKQAGYRLWREDLTVDGGDKTQTISQPSSKAGRSELSLEQKGLSSFGARTLPRGRSTVDVDAGYPYFAGIRITVGAGRIAKRFGFDATVAVRTMFDRTELGLGGRAMFVNADPMSAGIFSNLWYGSKLFDDSQRNGITWDAGGVVSLTALSNVTISGRAYLQIYSDRHCPELQPGNTFEATDPAPICLAYLARVGGTAPMNDFTDAELNRAEKPRNKGWTSTVVTHVRLTVDRR
jgi:hypothetical protein